MIRGGRWVLAASLVLIAVPAGADEPAGACAPAPMVGVDWAAAVTARQAACGGSGQARSFGTNSRAMTVVAIYDSRVRFAFDSVELLPEALPTLDRLAAYLQSSSGATRYVRIEGHTDATGRADYNMLLSQRRADATRFYLIGRGVPADRLTARGFGLTRPLPEIDPFAAENRRVQFRISSEPE